MSGLPGELFVGFLLVALALTIHMAGLFALVRFARLHIEHLRTPWLALDRMLVPLGIGTGLFTLAGVEVWAFAAAFQLLSATHSWEQALYVSAGSYSTAGWSGTNVPNGWRVLTGIEAIAGMLLTGWSTAFLFQTLHRILETERTHPLPEGAIAPEPDQAGEDAAGELEAESESPRPSGSGSRSPLGTN